MIPVLKALNAVSRLRLWSTEDERLLTLQTERPLR
jgi:hypothetical protein